jgi:hypothetical protein
MGTGLSIAITSTGLLYVTRVRSSLARNLKPTHRGVLADHYPVESRARVFDAHSFAHNVGQRVGPLAVRTNARCTTPAAPTDVDVTCSTTQSAPVDPPRYAITL